MKCLIKMEQMLFAMMYPKGLISFLVFALVAFGQPLHLLASQGVVHRESKTSQQVFLGKDKKLVYAEDSKGNRIPDFSHVGYRNLEVPIPDLEVKVTLKPGVGDDTERIQKALDEVGRIRANTKGQRGAVLLKKGVYRVSGTLDMNQSGVVLRGEGDGPSGTIIVATGYGDKKFKRTLINVGNSDEVKLSLASKQDIVTDFVPIGAHSFEVKSTQGFKAGDRIVVFRPSTQTWLSSIGMDRIAPRITDVWDTEWVKEGPNPGFIYQRSGLSRPTLFPKSPAESWEAFQKRVPLSEDGKKMDVTRQWEAGTYDFNFERRITKIRGNTITIDAPIVHPLVKKFGGGAIFKFTHPERVFEVGIENLRLISEFAEGSEKHPYGDPKKSQSSELHGWNAIKLNPNSENTWVRNVTGNYFGWSLVSAEGVGATITDCVNLGHASKIAGGRRYPFMVRGQRNLVQRCITHEGRHEFVNQSRTPGPNVFVDCIGKNSRGPSGPHHRYAIGNLYDNIRSSRIMESRNAGNAGTGHGWRGTQTLFYNCQAPKFRVEAPPGGISWVIGSGKDKENRVKPPSLFYQQVLERLGQEALDRLVSQKQRDSLGDYVWVEERLKQTK